MKTHIELGIDSMNYSGQLRREVNEEREKMGKKPIEDEDDENHPQGVEAHRKP